MRWGTEAVADSAVGLGEAVVDSAVPVVDSVAEAVVDSAETAVDSAAEAAADVALLVCVDCPRPPCKEARSSQGKQECRRKCKRE